MKFSKFFMPTTKEAPKDATLPSHQYLIRGGFIAQTGAGIYDFMPLGKIVLEKIRAIVKEEMDNAGANEVQLGFVTPLSLWEESGRSNTMGHEMLRFKDRKNSEFVLSPTNEEAVVNMVKNRITSYKDLPVHLYQINTKFRDEARPRFGLMRGREFLMKDGYSFHTDEECLEEEYQNMRRAYSRIFKRCGLTFRAVEADSGAIGGDTTHEIMVLAESGEDDVIYCSHCDYAANIEKAESKIELSDSSESMKEINKIHTPDKQSIEEVAAFLNLPVDKTVKGMIFKSEEKFILALIRGDYEINEVKLKNALKLSEIEMATNEEIESIGFKKGIYRTCRSR